MNEQILIEEICALKKQLEEINEKSNIIAKIRMDDWNNNFQLEMMIDDFIKGGENNLSEIFPFLCALQSILFPQINEKDEELEADMKLLAELENEFNMLNVNDQIEEEIALIQRELAMKEVEFDRSKEKNELFEQKKLEITKEITNLMEETNSLTNENEKLTHRHSLIDDENNNLEEELKILKQQYIRNDDLLFELSRQCDFKKFSSAWYNPN
ncbi:hypothetical protein PVAND_008511 [Polypedilum vanderplanki]|uniref:Uncharacterized protein n=1 Tax=Polypedilum vanderplanki TaxID=319348 RepID=A0A9J6CAU9_POLVA|nr:hypothetical protein PVAND_008511 [Polypedilum vanderplanki]